LRTCVAPIPCARIRLGNGHESTDGIIFHAL
jgi:hypothetical protein